MSMSSNATCESGYDWAGNGAGIEPCVLAAIAVSCNTGAHTIPPLKPGSHYNPPSLQNNSVNVCQCSWAAYNLMSMCTACQGQMDSLSPWVSYIVECTGFTTDSYFPTTISLPANATIPLYAQVDPDQWMNGVFNITQAKQIVDGTISLSTSTPAASHNKEPIAIIVGASVGGFVFLLCIAGFVVWLVRRRKSSRLGFQALPYTYTPSHSRQSTMSGIPHSILTRSSTTGHTIASRYSHAPTVFRTSNYSLYPLSEESFHSNLEELQSLQGPVESTPIPNHVHSLAPFTLKYQQPETAESTPQGRRKTAPAAVVRSSPVPVPESSGETGRNQPTGRDVETRGEGMSSARRPSSPPPYES